MPDVDGPEGLPQYLLADDAKCERTFVVHTQRPRFIAEVIETRTLGAPQLEPHWIDDVHDIEIDEIKRLMRHAVDWYLKTLHDDAANN